MTRDGRQLSAEWTDKRLARLAQEHPDPRLRQLASEVLRLKEAHPEKVRPQLHSLSIGEDSYRVLRVNAKSGAVEGVASEGSVTRFLKTISQADVSPATRQAASRHLQQFDQIQASALGREVSTSHISTRPAAVAPIKPGSAPTQATKLLPGAVVEAAAAESGAIAKALPIAAKWLPVIGLGADA